MDLGHGASGNVKQPKWIAFGVPYTDAVILATVSKDRLSGMIYDPLINRPPEPWSHDCPHCQKDTSTRWPLKARKALRMLRLARVSRNGIWEVELAPNYTFRGKLGEGWKGTVTCYDGKTLMIDQDPEKPIDRIAGAKESLTSKMATRHLRMILMARVPKDNEIAACLASLEAASQEMNELTPCRKMKSLKIVGCK